MLEANPQGAKADFEKDLENLLEVLLKAFLKDLEELGHDKISFFDKSKLKTIFKRVFNTCYSAFEGGRQSGSFFARLAHLAMLGFCTELEEVIKPNLAGKQLIVSLGLKFYECQIAAFLSGLQDGLILQLAGEKEGK